MKSQEIRVDWQIKAPSVRLVHDGNQLGIFSISEARKKAQELELNLVEVAPQAKPPVCNIMDYGKYKFDLKIKEKENRRKQREAQTEVKQIRLRPMIDVHDVMVKVNQAKKFLEDGKKVQFNLQYKGNRELAHKDVGMAVIKQILTDIEEICSVEAPPKMEGNRLSCRIAPK